MGQSHCKLKPSQLQGCLSVPRVIEPNADLAGIGVWASFATTCAIAFTASLYLTWKYHWPGREDRGSRVGHLFTISIVANTIDVQIVTAIALIGAAINHVRICDSEFSVFDYTVVHRMELMTLATLCYSLTALHHQLKRSKIVLVFRGIGIGTALLMWMLSAYWFAGMDTEKQTMQVHCYFQNKSAALQDCPVEFKELFPEFEFEDVRVSNASSEMSSKVMSKISKDVAATIASSISDQVSSLVTAATAKKPKAAESTPSPDIIQDVPAPAFAVLRRATNSAGSSVAETSATPSDWLIKQPSTENSNRPHVYGEMAAISIMFVGQAIRTVLGFHRRTISATGMRDAGGIDTRRFWRQCLYVLYALAPLILVLIEGGAVLRLRWVGKPGYFELLPQTGNEACGEMPDFNIEELGNADQYWFANENHRQWGFGQIVPFVMLLTIAYAGLEQVDAAREGKRELDEAKAWYLP